MDITHLLLLSHLQYFLKNKLFSLMKPENINNINNAIKINTF